MVKKVEKKSLVKKVEPIVKLEPKNETLAEKRNTSGNTLDFHQHISKFFANPLYFFEKTANESFFQSVKYFGLFFLFILISNLIMGKPADVNWGMYVSVLIGTFSFIYLVFPALLNLSGKLIGIKSNFSKVTSMFFYISSYIMTLLFVFRVILTGLQKLPFLQNVYMNVFMTIFSGFVLMISFAAFVYYTVVGFSKYFQVEGRKGFFAFVIFIKILFLLTVVSSFVLIWVIQSGNMPGILG